MKELSDMEQTLVRCAVRSELAEVDKIDREYAKERSAELARILRLMYEGEIFIQLPGGAK